MMLRIRRWFKSLVVVSLLTSGVIAGATSPASADQSSPTLAEVHSTASTNTSVSLAWTIADDGGADLSSGSVAIRVHSDSEPLNDWGSAQSTDTPLTTVVRSLSPNTQYDFQVRVSNENGESTPLEITVTTATSEVGSVSVPPTQINIKPGATRADVSWTPVDDSRFENPVLGYVVQYRVDGTNDWLDVPSSGVSGTCSTDPLSYTVTSRCTLTGLTVNTSYEIQIAAINNVFNVDTLMPTVGTFSEPIPFQTSYWTDIYVGTDFNSSALVYGSNTSCESPWVTGAPALQLAIDKASVGGTIHICPGSHQPDATNDRVTITKNLNIVGASNGESAFYSGYFSFFITQPDGAPSDATPVNVNFDHLRFDYHYGTNGLGAIRYEANTSGVITNSKFRSNTAGAYNDGGAISADTSAHVSVDRSWFGNNTARFGGALANVESVSNSVFIQEANYSQIYGGTFIYWNNNRAASIEGSTFYSIWDTRTSAIRSSFSGVGDSNAAVVTLKNSILDLPSLPGEVQMCDGDARVDDLGGNLVTQASCSITQHYADEPKPFAQSYVASHEQIGIFPVNGYALDLVALPQSQSIAVDSIPINQCSVTDDFLGHNRLAVGQESGADAPCDAGAIERPTNIAPSVAIDGQPGGGDPAAESYVPAHYPAVWKYKYGTTYQPSSYQRRMLRSSMTFVIPLTPSVCTTEFFTSEWDYTAIANRSLQLTDNARLNGGTCTVQHQLSALLDSNGTLYDGVIQTLSLDIQTLAQRLGDATAILSRLTYPADDLQYTMGGTNLAQPVTLPDTNLNSESFSVSTIGPCNVDYQTFVLNYSGGAGTCHVTVTATGTDDEGNDQSLTVGDVTLNIVAQGGGPCSGKALATTSARTQMTMSDINIVCASDNIGEYQNAFGFTEYAGEMYFSMSSPRFGYELFKTDGENISLVADANEGMDSQGYVKSTDPNNFAVFNNKLYFFGNKYLESGQVDRVLYAFDGDQISVVDTGTYTYDFSCGRDTQMVVASALYFVASTTEHGCEVQKFDGSNFSTINIGSDPDGADVFSGWPSKLLVVDGDVFTIAKFSAGGNNRLVKITAQSGPIDLTATLDDLRFGASNPRLTLDNTLATDGSTIYYTAMDTQTWTGYSIYKQDAAFEGAPVRMKLSGRGISGVTEATVFNGDLYFVATKNGVGRELFRTTSGNSDPAMNNRIELARNFAPDTADTVRDGYPRYLMNVNNSLLMIVNELSGESMWSLSSAGQYAKYFSMNDDNEVDAGWFDHPFVYHSAVYVVGAKADWSSAKLIQVGPALMQPTVTVTGTTSLTGDSTYINGANTLTVSTGQWKYISIASGLQYQWFACTSPHPTAGTVVPNDCTTLSTASGKSYVLDYEAYNKYVLVKVSGSNSLDQKSQVSATTDRVRGVPVSTVSPSVTGTRGTGRTVTFNAGTWMQKESQEIHWYSCEGDPAAYINIGDAMCTDVTSMQDHETYVVSPGDVNHWILVKYFARNTYGGDAASESVVFTNYIGPIIPIPAMSKTPKFTGQQKGDWVKLGGKLSFTPGVWVTSDVDNTLKSKAWYRCDQALTVTPDAIPSSCVIITSANNKTSYTTGAADAGKYIVNIETRAITGNPDIDAYGATSSVRVFAAITVKTPSRITGTARTGQQLTYVDTIWNGGTESVTRQWYRCSAAVKAKATAIPKTCTKLTGQTGLTYNLTNSDKGKFMVVFEVAKNKVTTKGLTSSSATTAKVS